MIAAGDIWRALRPRVTPEALAWLEEATGEGSPAAVRRAFPAAGRRLGRALLGDAAKGLAAWTAADAGRTLLVDSLGAAAPGEMTELYRFGSAEERRALMRSLEVVAVPRAMGAALVQDAIRTNDAELIAAALGPYGVAVLDDEALAGAVLKCVFAGIPLAAIGDLDTRATPRLSRMLAAYALERVVAGRDAPADAWPLIDRFPPTDLLDAIAAELQSPHEDRRRAAAAALTGKALR